MRVIGSRNPVSSARPFSRASASPEDLGAGVGSALRNLGAATADFGISQIQLNEEMKRREEKQRRANTDIEYLRWEGEQTRRAAEARSTIEPGAPGFTNRTFEDLGASFEEFAQRAGLDPEDRLHYAERFERFRQTNTTQAFAVEFEEQNRFFVENVKSYTDTAREKIRLDPAAFEREYADLTDIIDNSDIPPLLKDDLKQNVYEALAGQLFQSEVEAANRDERPVREADGSDVVAAGLSAAARGFLNATAGPESGGRYNALYPGTTFNNGYVDHPRIRSMIRTGPNAGRTSDAAGRYQFLSSTWDDLVAEMNELGYNITDFSPQNQDRVAWYYARKTYRSITGEDLESVIASGDRDKIKAIRRILTHKWEGFKNISDDAFANAVLGSRGLAGGGTGRSEAPSPWTDPRFANLPFDSKIQLEIAGAKAMEDFRASQARMQRETEQRMYEGLRRMFSDMDPTAWQQAELAIRNGAITEVSKIESLRGLYAQERQEQQTAREVGGRLVNGDVFTRDDREDVGTFARRSGLEAGVRGQTPDSVLGLRQLFDATGFLPDNILQILDSQMTSSNPQTQQWAMETLALLYEHNPRAFAGMSDERARDAAFMSTLFQLSDNPRVALENYNTMRGPQGAQMRRRFEEEADKLIQDQGPADFFRQATSWWTRNLPGFQTLTGLPRPQLPQTATENQLFSSDYMTMFKTYYAMFGGDESKAHEATGRLMSQTWHPSPLDGGMMKFSPLAPKMGVPTIDGNFSWIEPQMRRQFAGEDALHLRSDPQTLRDLQATGVPTYAVVRQNATGEFYVAKERWRAVPDPITRAEHELLLAQRNLADRANRVEIEGRKTSTTNKDLFAAIRQAQALREQARLMETGENRSALVERLSDNLADVTGRLYAIPENADPNNVAKRLELLNQAREIAKSMQTLGVTPTVPGAAGVLDLTRDLYRGPRRLALQREIEDLQQQIRRLPRSAGPGVSADLVARLERKENELRALEEE